PQAEQTEDVNNMAAQFANPAAWWSVVQDQFSQAVGNAMTPMTETPVASKTAAAKTTKTKSSSGTKKASTKSANGKNGAKKTTATARKKTD
ncbi:MAG: hypothetical protein NTZ99_06915, partial [Burkholderiales bacterium]|nr:hypothetical protein [Burkholderiales bacterium]